MFDFNEEFIIESYRVPWLIWVQLLVTILLLIVLFCGFSVFALDLSNNPSCSSASSSSLSNDKSNGKRPFVLNGSSSSSHGSKVEGNQNIQREIETSTSKGIVREESLESEQSSAKDAAFFRLFGLADHPCNYFGLAKQAIMKCLGLGYKHEKED